MPPATLQPAHSPLPLAPLRWLAGWARCWRRDDAPAPTDLHGVTDLAGLERRLRQLERGRPDRFAPLPR
ncbi:hypothetical protein ACG04Q_21925 [Roseateles sp. DXS20W]|uniref:Uncharacterized protein n=1 Tax=Pelomonas lactea TaxID=3299030 RepID=A0ABW7GQJ6_9BURK